MDPVLTPALLEELVAIRLAARRELDGFGARRGEEETTGGCWVVAEQIDLRYGFSSEDACYVLPDGSHATHEWNLLPDGRILDATADQFGEPDPGVRVAAAADPRYAHGCVCDRCFAGACPGDCCLAGVCAGGEE